MTEKASLGRNNAKNYTEYEYKKITAEEENISFLLDCYENFGWKPDDNFMETIPYANRQKAVLHLKRNRKIMNKTELTRLQRNFESCMKEISTMEAKKTSASTGFALGVGLIGTAFMAGAVFCITAETPYTAGCVLLSVPGFIGWILPYFVYRKVLTDKTEQLDPLIETKNKEIAALCEKGHNLLN